MQIRTQRHLKGLPGVFEPPEITSRLDSVRMRTCQAIKLQRATTPPAMPAAADHARTLAHKRPQARNISPKQRAEVCNQQQKRSQPKPSLMVLQEHAASHTTASVSANETMCAVQCSLTALLVSRRPLIPVCKGHTLHTTAQVGDCNQKKGRASLQNGMHRRPPHANQPHTYNPCQSTCLYIPSSAAHMPQRGPFTQAQALYMPRRSHQKMPGKLLTVPGP